MKYLIAISAFLIAGAMIFVVSAGWILGHPAQIRVGDPPPDLEAQSVAFESDLGTNVAGWWCPVPNSRGAVLLLPGIRATRLSMVDRARFLRRAGYSILLIDFQATGETRGDHITFGWKEARDVLAATEFIRRTQPSRQIAIIGSSLGGAAALLATPPLHVNALVLEAVYPTIDTATKNRLQNYLGPLGPLAASLLLKQLPIRLGISASDLRPVDHIGNVTCPLLVISGARDRNTRPEDTRVLYAAAQAPKQLWLVPNAGHVDLHQAATAEYESRVVEFLRQM